MSSNADSGSILGTVQPTLTGLSTPGDQSTSQVLSKAFDPLTSPARRGDMTRDRANHTSAYAATPGDEHPGVVSGVPAEIVRTGNKLSDAGGAVQAPLALQPEAPCARGAENEAVRGVGSAGGGPAAGDVKGSKAKEIKDWHCEECKRWMTLRQAQRAMEHGCLAGCSGIDIEHVPGGRR